MTETGNTALGISLASSFGKVIFIPFEWWGVGMCYE